MRKVAAVKNFTGNVDHGIRLINGQANKDAILNSITSNTKEFTNKAMKMVSGVDASTGGHGGNILGSLKSAMDSSKLLGGLIPDASEFHQIKKTMDGATADKLKEYSYNQSAKHLEALYNMRDFPNAESLDVLGKNYNMAKMSDKQKKALKSTIKTKGISYRDSVKQLEQGYLMQDQNFLEKTQTYFSNTESGGKRKAAAGVAVAGLGIMNRYNNGGTLTRDEYGERDIIGLPYL